MCRTSRHGWWRALRWLRRQLAHWLRGLLSRTDSPRRSHKLQCRGRLRHVEGLRSRRRFRRRVRTCWRSLPRRLRLRVRWRVRENLLRGGSSRLRVRLRYRGRLSCDGGGRGVEIARRQRGSFLLLRHNGKILRCHRRNGRLLVQPGVQCRPTRAVSIGID